MTAAEWQFREPPGHELYLTKQFMSITRAKEWNDYHVWVWDWHWINGVGEVQSIMWMQKIIRPKRK